MMRILFFLIFLNILNGQNKPLSFFEQKTLNELSYDSIVKTKSISKFLETNDYMFIENGKNYFHILLRNGFLTGPFDDNEFIYKNYSSPTPREINVELQALIPAKIGSETYLLYPGGGLLFKFNERSGAIKRIDRSFAHRNQYSGYFFSHNKNLYMLGGYGFWETKSLLTKFNFSSGEWDFVACKGQAPDGIDRGAFLIKNDKLYAAGFVSRNSNNQKENREDNLYVLNLPSSTEEDISSNSYKWEKKGVLNPLLLDAKITPLNKDWIHNDNLLVNILDDPNLYLINPTENIIQTIPNDLLIYKSGGKSIMTSNKIISTVRNSATGRKSLAFFDIKGIENYPNITDEYLYRNVADFYYYLIFGAILFSSVIIFLWFFFINSNKTYILVKDEIVHVKGVLKLSKIERHLIALFVHKKLLSNSKIMSLFNEKSKTKDYAVKRKNKTTSNLNKRFLNLFDISLFSVEKSKKDSRQTNYVLNKKINFKEV